MRGKNIKKNKKTLLIFLLILTLIFPTACGAKQESEQAVSITASIYEDEKFNSASINLTREEFEALFIPQEELEVPEI